MVKYVNNIHKNQSSVSNVKIAAAFRHAYGRAKYWKSWIWFITSLLAFLQVLTSINHQNLKNYLPDNLAAIAVTVSLLLMLINTLGKHYLVNKFINLGSILHRLHDFETLGLGTKPTMLEIRPSQIQKFSKSWLDNNPNDHPNLSEWYPISVSDLPANAGISLSLLSTIKWENELRKKYKFVLLFIGFTTFAISFLLMHLLDYKISDYIFNLLVPLSPFIAILIQELLLCNSCLEVAKNASLEAQKLWNTYSSTSDGQLNNKNELNQLNYLWSNYRSTASPIFDWLYWVTQKNMNMDMVVDADELVKMRKK